MKHKIYLLLLSFLSFIIYPESCLNFAVGSPIVPLLHAMQSAHTIIKHGQNPVITQPGSYILLENINSNITVDTSNVIIDLNGFTLEYNTRDVIRINPGNQNVVIKNGTIRTSGEYEGIEVDQGSKFVRIESVNIIGGDSGIYLDGDSDSIVECCKVTNCTMTGCQEGVRLSYANNCIFKNVEACFCSKRGFLVENSKYNKFFQCKAVKIGPNDADDSTVGFDAKGGQDNLFYECMAEGVYKTVSNWCTKAIGFNFGFYEGDVLVPETESKIINCCVDSIDGVSLGNAFGINLEMTYILQSEAIVDSTSARVFDISPSDQYIALGSGTSLFLYKFNRLTNALTLVDQLSFVTDISEVEWSPTGQYIAFDSSTRLFVYRFKENIQELQFVDSFDLNDNISHSIHWNRRGDEILVTTDGTTGQSSVRKLFFDGFSLLELENIEYFATGEHVAKFSPDDNYVLVTRTDNGTGEDIYLYKNTDFGLQLIKIVSNTDGLDFADAEWCPVACCGKYYFVVSGIKRTNGSAGHLELFEFDSVERKTTLLQSLSPVGTVANFEIEWAPNGKHLAVLLDETSVKSISFYSFDPSLDTPLVFVEFIAVTGATSLSELVWSVSGRYLGFIKNAEGYLLQVHEVADVVQNCVVENNKIANVSGGLCGIGLIGPGAWNLIDKNLLFGSCINASRGVYNTFFDFKTSTTQSLYPQALDNLAFEAICC